MGSDWTEMKEKEADKDSGKPGSSKLLTWKQ